MAFVMVLSYSRQIFLRFFLDARMESFLRGHAAAFAAWGGVPRVLLYDNLKSAVLERHGDAIRFHPDAAGLRRALPLRAAPGGGRPRQRERPRRARHPLCPRRLLRRAQLRRSRRSQRPGAAWCSGPAADRRCPDEPQRSVREVFADERRRLLPLPDNPAPLLERVEVRVGKTPYVRFDLNDYSVPHTHVRRVLTVLADPQEVRIVDGGAGARLPSRAATTRARRSRIPPTSQALVEQKRAARQHRATDRLAQAAPASQALLRAPPNAARNSAPSPRRCCSCSTAMAPPNCRPPSARRWSATCRTPTPCASRSIAQREQHGTPPPVAIVLPAHVQARDARCSRIALATYDRLKDAADD